MSIVVGIDLGTTYSAVAYIDPNTNKPLMVPNAMGGNITPSVVRFLQDGSVICGAQAKEDLEAGEYGCASSFKRFISHKTPFCTFYGIDHTAEELSGLLLRHLKSEAEASLRQTIEEAVITVPAHFYDAEKRATRRAAESAGLKVRRIINEPTAAALNYGLNHWRENAVILVYDLGGGTFDVTLVSMDRNMELKTLSTKGDHALGGKDWDRLLKDMIIEQILEETGLDLNEDRQALAQLVSQTEGLKWKLGQSEQVSFDIRLEGYGRYSTQIERSKFEARTAALLDNTGNLCEHALKAAGLKWEQVNDVLLVGGSTRMPQVSAYLTQKAKRAPISHVHPDEAVALGAAMQTLVKEEEYLVYKPREEKKSAGGLFSREPQMNDMAQLRPSLPVKPAVILDDIASITKVDIQCYGMGVIAANPEGTAFENKTIIPAGLRIPVKSARKLKFYTTSRKPNEMDIYVLEGVGPLKDSRVLARYLVSGIRHCKGGETIIRVQYSYDRNGCVNVQARQEEDNTDLPIQEAAIPEDMFRYYQPLDLLALKQRDELTIIMALDVSGSMSGKPMEDAKNAMQHFVDEYADSKACIGIMAVSDNTNWYQEPTDDYQLCKEAISQMQVGVTGFGNSAHPFDEIHTALSALPGRRIAIVLADGAWANQSTAIDKAKACHQRGIEIYGIGFGSAIETFLRAISSDEANAMKVDQSQLKSTFGSIAQSISVDSSHRGASVGEMDLADTWQTEES